MSKPGLSVALCCGLLFACSSDERSDVKAARVELGQDLRPETEPNGTSMAATPIANDTVVRAPVFPFADVDHYSFQAQAGDRVNAAVMTAWSAGLGDSRLRILGTDGMTVLELDEDDGNLVAQSSSIAGLALSASGTYFVQVSSPTGFGLRPYDLHFKVQRGAPEAEVEPNDTDPNAMVLPAAGFVSGSTSSAADVDLYAIRLNAGDTVYAALDLDPERDLVEWDGALAIGRFNGGLLTVNDPGAATFDSEALFETAKTSGVYIIQVAAAPQGVTFGTYQLSVSVHPGTAATASCTTYNSPNVPVAIPAGPGLVTSTIAVPGNPRVADLDVSLAINHMAPQDLDVHLTAPGGNVVGFFTDVGLNSASNVNVTLDDEAARPINAFTNVDGVAVQPELLHRLHWFDGQNAGGTWTLSILDDAAGNAGNLTAWSMTICEPHAPPACSGAQSTIFASDFEADDGGFTHSGVQDEWERGTPSLDPITNCNGGSSCWKTDLDNTYNNSANMDLVSAPIDLSAVDPDGSIRLSWAMKYQLESASFDHASVDIRHVDDSNPRRLFEFLDATMSYPAGNPQTTIHESAGWALYSADVSAYAGSQVELVFHLDTDSSVILAGLAIDDVAVTACVPVCGNGIVEAGEICDHGASTGQVGDCCSATCTFAPVTTQCRAAADACDVAEMCDGAGECPADELAADGSSCDDTDLCTQTDTCQSGVCSGSNPVVCTALDSCHVAGVCNPATGVCSNPNQNDGTACNDGDMCTQTDTCQTGTCTGGNPVVCTALDSCHVAGVCNPATGCSNPNQNDGTACDDGDWCTLTDTCQTGTCTGTAVVCTAVDECHMAGTCNPATGTCSSPEQPDGTDCGTDGMCMSGACEESPPQPEEDAGVEAGSGGDGAGTGGDGAGTGGAGGAGAGGASAGSGGRGADAGTAGRGSAGRGSGTAGRIAVPSGDAGPDGSTEPMKNGDDGCGCSVPGRTRRELPALSLAALALAGLLQRRRKRR